MSSSLFKVVKQLPVIIRPPVEEQIQEDATFCEICQQCDREDRMLLCDGCDLGYHLECLTPPMTEVPMDEWFCPECSQNSQNDAEVVMRLLFYCFLNNQSLETHGS